VWQAVSDDGVELVIIPYVSPVVLNAIRCIGRGHDGHLTNDGHARIMWCGDCGVSLSEAVVPLTPAFVEWFSIDPHRTLAEAITEYERTHGQGTATVQK
jgi:hypothetical protein